MLLTMGFVNFYSSFLQTGLVFLICFSYPRLRVAGCWALGSHCLCVFTRTFGSLKLNFVSIRNTINSTLFFVFKCLDVVSIRKLSVPITNHVTPSTTVFLKVFPSPSTPLYHSIPLNSMLPNSWKNRVEKKNCWKFGSYMYTIKDSDFRQIAK